MRIFQQPVAATEHPNLDVRLIGKQRQRGQCGSGRQVIRDEQTAIGMNEGAAIEGCRGQVDTQGLDCLQHGPGWAAGGQAERHPGLAQ
ncbi:hypothetical protein D3C81_2153220 [compost metagenome]